MADRQEWDHATQQSRHLAIASDTELCRRHPNQTIEPLHSAEQGPVNNNERLHPTPEDKLTETAAWIRDLAAQHQAFQAKMNERQQQVAREDLDWAGPCETLRSPWVSYQDAILRPPKPQITPSTTILQPAAKRDAEHEAGS